MPFNDGGRCDVGDCINIIQIAAGAGHTMGLRSDGTVVATSITNPSVDCGQSAVDFTGDPSG